MPLTGTWRSHPVASTFTATQTLREILIEARAIPFPAPGGEQPLWSGWQRLAHHIQRLQPACLAALDDGTAQGELLPLVVKSLGTDTFRAESAVDSFLAVRAAVRPPHGSPNGMPSADWWEMGTRVLAQTPPLTTEDVEREEAREGSYVPATARLFSSGPQGTKAGTVRTIGGPTGNPTLALLRAVIDASGFLGHHLPEGRHGDDASAAFRQLAELLRQPPREEDFADLAARNNPFRHFCRTASSACRWLWQEAPGLYRRLADALISSVPSGMVEAARIRAGVAHPADLTRLPDWCYGMCRTWADGLTQDGEVEARLECELAVLRRSAPNHGGDAAGVPPTDDRDVETAALAARLKGLSDPAQRAYLEYRTACGEHGDELTDKAAYDILKDDMPDDSRPNLETWKRHLRTARNHLGEQRRHRRRPATESRSAVLPDGRSAVSTTDRA